MGGRSVDLLVKMLVHSPLTTYQSRISPLTIFRRCHGCGRVVRRPSIKSNITTITAIPWRRGLTVQAIAQLPQEHHGQQEQYEQEIKERIPQHSEHVRDISAAIIKLSRKRRTTEALHQYVKALSKNQWPSKESLYQLANALYLQKNLSGLYALHDTLLVQYKTITPLSNRKRRSMIYLYTMLIKLISNKTPPQQPLDMESIVRLCHELADYNVANRASLYNALIHLFMKRRDYSSCHALFDNMKERHIQPTVYTYSILLKVYGWQKDLDGMAQLLDDMYERQISPDAGIVSVVVFGLCRQREFDTARQFVNRLFQNAGGDAWLIGINMREQLLQNIGQSQEKHHQRKARRINTKNKRRKKV
ncbi:hypothetical protein BDA99DRAFT_510128 [Phascolomyces articulosus]|uniref:Pentatricopeptide repeat-containing protein n=1 Tax=Phascolomyces articulosus TaxID=60185 RepID=A0AAD5K0K2_9FUNG|nr:hypothetical protein BDA99DRAFT_510128 [Phascolomyces articulosus]